MSHETWALNKIDTSLNDAWISDTDKLRQIQAVLSVYNTITKPQPK